MQFVCRNYILHLVKLSYTYTISINCPNVPIQFMIHTPICLVFLLSIWGAGGNAIALYMNVLDAECYANMTVLGSFSLKT